MVEYATNQFEENTKKIEELIRQREQNIVLAGQLKELIEVVTNKEEDWKEQVKKAEKDFSEDIIDTLNLMGRTKSMTSQNYKDAEKLLHARVNNLESNLHIEIDMERIEDRSKALSYIGIEVADALKSIPTPVDMVETPVENEVQEQIPVKEEAKQDVKQAKKAQEVKNIQEVETVVEPQDTIQGQLEEQERQEYTEQTTFEVKPSLWQRIKNSKLVRTIKYIMKIKVVLDYPALPEGKGENS